MNRRKLFAPALAACLGLAVAAFAAEPAKSTKKEAAPAAGQAEMKLPPGWTQADMERCMAAATPGKEHERLARDVGQWHGKNTMWMYPGAEPMNSECTYTVTTMMDGRYIKGEMAGEMPGMGPFSGFCITGYDNVAKQFVSTWIDTQSTGIMNGVGQASPDGKALTWKFNFHCPMTGKPEVMRQVETNSGPESKTLEMWSNDPKSGKEYKMMRIEFTKKKSVAQAAK